MKIVRFGIKLYELTTSDGITLDFCSFVGKVCLVMMIYIVICNQQNEYQLLWWNPVLAKDVFYLPTTMTQVHLWQSFSLTTIHIYVAQWEQTGFHWIIDELRITRMVACKYQSAKDKAIGQQKVVYMLSTCNQPTMENVNNVHGMNVLKPAAVK